MGRWDQAEQLSREGLETSPSGPAYVALPLARAALELGLGDLDAAQARLQAVRRLLPVSIPQAQYAGPLLGGLAELALWRGHPDQAKQLVDQAVPQVAANPRHAAPIYALGVRIEADIAELARARHPRQPAPDDHTATTLLDRLDRAATGRAGAGLPELAAWYATARAEQTRQQGPSDPAAWAAAAAAWELGQPPDRLRRLPPRRSAAGHRRRPRRRGGAAARRRGHRSPGRPTARRRGAGPGPARPPGPGPPADGAAAAPAAGAPTVVEQLGLTPRGRGAGAGGGRAQQPPDRPGAVHQPQDRRRTRLQHPRQAGVAGRVEAATIAHRLGLD